MQRRKSTKAEEPVPSAEAGAPAEAGPTTPAAAAPPAPAPAESPAAAEGKAAADDAAPAAPIDATVAVKKLEKPTLQSEEWGMAVLSGAVAQLRDGGWGAAADKVQRILDEGLEGAKP